MHITQILLQLLLLGVIILVVKFFIKRYILLNKLKCWTNVPGWPLIGNTLDFIDYTKVLFVALDYVKNWGDIIVINLIHGSALFITEPKLAEFVSTSTDLLQKGPNYQLLHNWFGKGLLTSSGSKWRSHRKILTPTFHYKILEDFIKIFDHSSKLLVQKLEKEVGKDSFEIFDPISLHTLDIIYESAMGTKINAQVSPNSDFVLSVKRMVHIIVQRIFSLPLNIDFTYNLTKLRRDEIKALKILHKSSKDIISERKKVLLEKPAELEDISEIGIKRKNTFLDTLLTATVDGRSLTDNEVKEEVDTFIFEGHDTTAVALSFLMFELGRHSEIQNKAYEEVRSIFGDDFERSTTLQDLQEMNYLEMVIKEALRLYPSVPAYSRTAIKDINYDGRVIPKDIEVILAPIVMHRNPKIFPDPEKFDPERFTVENIGKRHPFSYIPFSAGHRNCIGQKFAMMEMKTTISTILKHFEIVLAIPEHHVQLMGALTLISINGIKIQLKNRK